MNPGDNEIRMQMKQPSLGDGKHPMPSPSGARGDITSGQARRRGQGVRRRLADNITLRLKCGIRAVGDILMKHLMCKQLVSE